MAGLGAIWGRVVGDIEWLVEHDCYERVNGITSLFMVGRLRRRAARSLSGLRVVLDAGAGPGHSTRAVLEAARGVGRVIALDPSPRMLSRAAREIGGPVGFVVGRFEALPLASSSVDGVVMMFSFRDAVSYRDALREACRVLAPQGRLVILDLYRPDSRIAEAAVKAYLAVVPPLAALLAGCPRGAGRYVDLVRTLERMPRGRELLGMVREYFARVEAEKPLPGTAIIRAEAPRKERCRVAGGG